MVLATMCIHFHLSHRHSRLSQITTSPALLPLHLHVLILSRQKIPSPDSSRLLKQSSHLAHLEHRLDLKDVRMHLKILKCLHILLLVCIVFSARYNGIDMIKNVSC